MSQSELTTFVVCSKKTPLCARAGKSSRPSSLSAQRSHDYRRFLTRAAEWVNILRLEISPRPCQEPTIRTFEERLEYVI